MTDRLVERTRATLSRLFEEASEGTIDIGAVDGLVHPVMRALRERGVQPWLGAVHAHERRDTI